VNLVYKWARGSAMLSESIQKLFGAARLCENSADLSFVRSHILVESFQHPRLAGLRLLVFAHRLPSRALQRGSFLGGQPIDSR